MQPIYQTAPRSSKRTRGFGSILLLLVLLALLVLAALAALNRQAVFDWFSLRGYQPPPAISQLASDDTMTAYARHVYYVNHPQIDPKASFASECPSGTEQTVVLGCYHGNQGGIFLLAVNDPQLNGVEQVTAAHETLHAAYDRLSTAKRQQVDGWLMDYYQHDLTDPTIEAQIASYKKTEPEAVVNEMNSLFGTEVGSLPSQLEQYYQQYFTNRAAVVASYDNYEAAFTSRQNQIKQDDVQLSTWKTQISDDEADLKAKNAAISATQQSLDREKASGDIGAYNNGVPAYNAQVNAYNAEVGALHALIAKYNQLVDTRNGLVLEEQQLVQELSGSSVPASK